MSNVQQFFGNGTGATGLYQFHVSTFSGTFTAKIRTKYLITAIGAGGAGGAYGGGGGGAGGLAQSILTLEVGDVLTYICGAGAQNANGGNTTIALNSIGILSATGGQQGLTGVGSSPGIGGNGGVGQAGNVMNVNGGRGSNGFMYSGQGFLAGGGGGAVGVYGKVCDAQNGGLGRGAGTSGNPSLTCFMNAMELSQSDIAEGGVYSYHYGTLAPTITGVIPIFQNRILQPTGYTSTGSQSGAGVGGQQGGQSYYDSYGQPGGMFAGGGGTYGSNYYGGGGSGGAFGGGGGGSGLYANQNYYNVTGGKGGNGGVIIEWMAYTL